MKTAEEPNALKEEAESMNKKPAELNEDALKQVSGGIGIRQTSFSDENSESIDWEQLIEG